jgi:aspartyl-tRNA(Asn)/glutamyl-tRNA(Gln) amidotransferase subunit A
MLRVIAGYDELDPTTADAPVPDYSRAFKTQASTLRLGIPRTPFFDSLEVEIAKAVDTAFEVLRKRTATVEEITLPSASLPCRVSAEFAHYPAPLRSGRAWLVRLPNDASRLSLNPRAPVLA